MKLTCILLTIIFFSVKLYSQEDTVFITYNKDWTNDVKTYVTDTITFPTGLMRNILTGTTVLPWTHNQQNAKGYGLYLDKVSKSDCLNSGEEVYHSIDKINSIINTDSTLTIDINIYDNCCYDFLCDISVDSTGTINLIYHGYGNYCACDCCFGMVYHFTKINSPDYDKIQAVVIGNDKRTLKKIE
ncbi:MAG: hypothetical protein Salg2KO_14740 [Salibacteraceae bacterium]